MENKPTWKQDKAKIKKRLYSGHGKASIQKTEGSDEVKITYRGGDVDYFWTRQFARVVKEFPQYQFN